VSAVDLDPHDAGIDGTGLGRDVGRGVREPEGDAQRGADRGERENLVHPILRIPVFVM
jgi:hypothetical protein